MIVNDLCHVLEHESKIYLDVEIDVCILEGK